MRNINTRSEKLAWISSGIGLFFIIVAFSLAKSSGILSLSAATVSAVVTLMLSLTAVARIRLVRKLEEEEEEFTSFRERHESTELFDDSDEAVKLASRNEKQFIKFFLPVISFIIAVVAISLVYYFRNQWENPLFDFTPNGKPLQHSVMAMTTFFLSLIVGSYFVGASREKSCRWLRPAGAWLFLTGAFFATASITMIVQHFEAQNLTQELMKKLQTTNLQIGKITLYIIVALIIELIINVIIDYYRPRSSGEEERPIFESKILALFTEPGGVARNIANTLDYQFGFKVSEAWFYRFLERTVIPLVVVSLFCLWLLTSISIVKIEENGVRERFGKIVRDVNNKPIILKPGCYLKLPAPFGAIKTFPVKTIETITIGIEKNQDSMIPEQPSEQEEESVANNGQVVLWTKKHSQGAETPFIVASKPFDYELKNQDNSTKPVACYYLNANIPVSYKIKDFYKYNYLHRNPKENLRDIATREVLQYMSTVDFFNILTVGRAKAKNELQERIQAVADKHDLGVEIVFISMQGLHPPVAVGKYFNDIVSAMEDKQTAELIAELYQIRAIPSAKQQAKILLSEAESYKYNRETVSKATANRYLQQLMAYKISPNLFMMNTYLDMMEQVAPTIRKFIVPANMDIEVISIDTKKKLKRDITDLDLSRQTP